MKKLLLGIGVSLMVLLGSCSSEPITEDKTYDSIKEKYGDKGKELIVSDNCMKVGSRLKLVSNKISKNFKSENVTNFGCVIRCKNTNRYGVNYTLSFSEEPNIYKISFNSDTPFKLKSGSFLEKMIKGDNETQKQLRELLNQELKNVVINGKYKINEFQQLSLYYITFNKINEKKENIYYNKEQRIYVVDEIINSFEYD